MPHADRALAQRLEALCAAERRRFAQTALSLDPAGGAAWLEVGGGVACYTGGDSPVNSAFGIGMSGEVGDADIAALERFYLERRVRPLAGACPLAHPSLVAALAARGWVVDGFEHVLVRALDAQEPCDDPAAVPDDTIEIREALTDDDRETWALVAATGFSDPLPPLPEQVALGRIVVRRPGTRLFTAWVDGRAAGTGELYIEDGVAWLSADTTLPQFRRRGVQQALQRHRLRLGAEAGCDLAATEAEPGSGSQRNMERAGFRIAYTRVDVTLPVTPHEPERNAE